MFRPLSSLALITVAGRAALAAPSFSKPSAPSIPRSESSSNFYLVDTESGSLANALYDPSGVFFGPSWSSPTFFTIDPSTSLLLTADPGQTSYNSFIDASDFSPVQIGTAAISGFVKCSIQNDQISCSADGDYTQFMLDETSDGSADSQLFLVKPGSNSTNARPASLKVQYASPGPEALPTKFYLSTSMGYAVDFGVDSGIYAGSNYAKEAPGSVYTIDNSTGYLTTSTSNSGSPSATYVACIDTASQNGYSSVQLVLQSAISGTISPVSCQIASDGSRTLSCLANEYQRMWLDRLSSISGDYRLYMATEGSPGKGSEKVDALAKVSACTLCS